MKNLEFIQFSLADFIIENLSKKMLNEFYDDAADFDSYTDREKARFVTVQVESITGSSLTEKTKKYIQEWKEQVKP